MKMKFATLFFLFIMLGAKAQNSALNMDKGYMAKGYDVVEYFDGNASKGIKSIKTSYMGSIYSFVNETNKRAFEKNPEQYIPQFGGYCAYAIGAKSEKVGIDPETFEIRDEKLYLFYNSWGVNTLKKWQKENTELLLRNANRNWEVLKK